MSLWSKRKIDIDSIDFTAFNKSILSPGTLRTVKNAQSDEAEVYIFGDIGGWWDDSVNAKAFVQELAQLDAKKLVVKLNSVGGSVFDGISIYNALVSHPASVEINITGIAASIASVIAMSGDHIVITEGSNVMIHKPWSIAMGDSSDMRKEADLLDKLETGIIDIYQARTGADRDKISKWMKAETWFLGQEAVDAGFCDECTPAKKKEKNPKSNLLNFYRNTPSDLAQHQESVAIRDFEALLRDGEGFSNAVAKRIAAYASKMIIPQRDVEETPSADDGGKQDEWKAVLRKNISQMRGK